MELIHKKECSIDIQFLVMRLHHDAFNWSQEVLLKALDILHFKTRDLENKRIDVIVDWKSKIFRVEHKYISLLTKRESMLIRQLNSEKLKINRKLIDLLIISTLTNIQTDIDEFLSPVNLCLHVVVIEGEYLNTTDVAEVAKTIIDKVENAMTEDEFVLSPNEAQILVMNEVNGRRINKVSADLNAFTANFKFQIEELQSNVSEVKTDVSSLRSNVSEVKTDVSEVKTDVSILDSKITKLDKELTNIHASLNTLIDLIKNK